MSSIPDSTPSPESRARRLHDLLSDINDRDSRIAATDPLIVAAFEIGLDELASEWLDDLLDGANGEGDEATARACVRIARALAATRPELAQRCLEVANACEPEMETRWRAELLRVQVRLGDLKVAIQAALEPWLSIYPGTQAFVQCQLAEQAVAAGMAEDAWRLLASAEQTLGPIRGFDCLAHRHHWIDLYRRLGDEKRVSEILAEVATSSSSGDRRYAAEHSKLLCKLGRVGEGIKLASRKLKRHPDLRRDVLIAAFDHYLDQGDLEQASKALAKLRGDWSRRGPANVRLALAMAESDPRQADRLLNEARSKLKSLNPWTAVPLLVQLAPLLDKRGRPEASEAFLNDAEELLTRKASGSADLRVSAWCEWMTALLDVGEVARVRRLSARALKDIGSLKERKQKEPLLELSKHLALHGIRSDGWAMALGELRERMERKEAHLIARAAAGRQAAHSELSVAGQILEKLDDSGLQIAFSIGARNFLSPERPVAEDPVAATTESPPFERVDSIALPSVRFDRCERLIGPAYRVDGIVLVAADAETEGWQSDERWGLGGRRLNAALKRRLFADGADAPWVLGRLLTLFEIKNPPLEERADKSCLEVAFLAILESRDGSGVPFELMDLYGVTQVVFGQGVPKTTCLHIARSFWKLLLSEPTKLQDYSDRMFVPQVGETARFGVREGTPFIWEAE